MNQESCYKYYINWWSDVTLVITWMNKGEVKMLHISKENFEGDNTYQIRENKEKR